MKIHFLRTRRLHDPTPHVPKVMELAFDHLHHPVERIFQCIASPCGTEGFPREGRQDTCPIAAAPMPLILNLSEQSLRMGVEDT